MISTRLVTLGTDKSQTCISSPELHTWIFYSISPLGFLISIQNCDKTYHIQNKISYLVLHLTSINIYIPPTGVSLWKTSYVGHSFASNPLLTPQLIRVKPSPYKVHKALPHLPLFSLLTLSQLHRSSYSSITWKKSLSFPALTSFRFLYKSYFFKYSFLWAPYPNSNNWELHISLSLFFSYSLLPSDYHTYCLILFIVYLPHWKV